MVQFLFYLNEQIRIVFTGGFVTFFFSFSVLVDQSGAILVLYDSC